MDKLERDYERILEEHFFNEERGKEKEYKELKKELIRRISSLKKVASKTGMEIIYQNGKMNAEAIIEYLDNLEHQIRNSSLNIDEKDEYKYCEKRKRKVFRTVHFLKEKNRNTKNSEEERLVNFLNIKQGMVQEVKFFVEVFNTLEEEEREIIYRSFFLSEKTPKLVMALGFSERTFERRKREIVMRFVDILIEVELKVNI